MMLKFQQIDQFLSEMPLSRSCTQTREKQTDPGLKT